MEIATHGSLFTGLAYRAQRSAKTHAVGYSSSSTIARQRWPLPPTQNTIPISSHRARINLPVPGTGYLEPTSRAPDLPPCPPPSNRRLRCNPPQRPSPKGPEEAPGNARPKEKTTAPTQAGTQLSYRYWGRLHERCRNRCRHKVEAMLAARKLVLPLRSP